MRCKYLTLSMTDDRHTIVSLKATRKCFLIAVSTISLSEPISLQRVERNELRYCRFYFIRFIINIASLTYRYIGSMIGNGYDR